MQDFQKQFILALLAYGAQRDIEPQQACKLAGLEYRDLIRNSKTDITKLQLEGLWKNLSYLSNDPLFGLHFGASMQLAALGVVGQIVQTSTTVGEALSNAGSLVCLITDLFTIQIEHGKKSFIIHLIPDAEKSESFPCTFRHMADYLMVFIVHELDGLLLHKIQPNEVCFPYELGAPYEYSRAFRCNVKQRQGGLRIELHNQYLTQNIISANYELQNQLLQKVSLLVNDPNGGSLQAKIFNFLLTNSYLYTMSLEAVAANFNVSPRTLQRKLKEEGISFLQIVDDVRQRLAIHYLTSGNYQVKNVAYTLGYNEQSAFIRAFKRWTGDTPKAYINKRAVVSAE